MAPRVVDSGSRCDHRLRFLREGKYMRRDRKFLGVALTCTAGLLFLQGGDVRAQTAREPVPDFAALIGVPMSKADVARARTRIGRSTVADVERRIAAAGIRRTPAQRVAAEGFNRTLAKMPETRAQALRESAARGDGVVFTSLEEFAPMYAVSNEGGGFSASHEPLQSATK